MKLSTLYHKGSNGPLYCWKVWTEGAVIHTQYGVVGGVQQRTQKTATPKNVGKANETTGEEQAIKEAKAMHKKKTDLKYTTDADKAGTPLPLPMLAKSYEDRRDKVEWEREGLAVPHFAQAKLDGVRCLARFSNGELLLTSRTGKEWVNLDHIEEQILDMVPQNVVLDGEIYHDGLVKHMKQLDWDGVPEEEIMTPFEVISSLVKKRQTMDIQGFVISTEDLEYHIYDGYQEGENDLRFADRNALIKSLFDTEVPHPHLIPVDTVMVTSHEKLMEFHDRCAEAGYEGAMLRLNILGKHSQYLNGFRSSGLLKVKVFFDEEFKIVDFTEGKGKAKGCIIWICEADNGKTFKSVHKGNLAHRQKLYQEAEQHIGSMLKVKFFERTGSGLPRFPVGVGIRLPEDM